MRLLELHTPIEIVEILKRDCAFYLNNIPEISTKLQMWRGMQLGGGVAPFSKQKAKVNRLPLHTPKELHENLNKFFIEKFGWPARNGTFVTWDMRVALIYGDLYALFPIGEFKYVWSPEVKDLYNNISNFTDGNGALDIPKVTEKLTSLTWKDTDLQTLPTKHRDCELVIDAKEYYLMSKSVVNSIDWEQL